MNLKRVIYHEPQETFFSDVRTKTFVAKMLKTAKDHNIHIGDSELMSWQSNGSNIKELLELSDVRDAYITFEYLIPYRRLRVDCMIYGRDLSGQGNVLHIELKQWNNKNVKAADCAGNFDIDDDASDNDFKVEAYTGGGHRPVAHPSQQVRGYHDYLLGFVNVLSTKELAIEGLAYCYNYKKNGDPCFLYDERYNQLQDSYRTYSGDEVAELARKLNTVLAGGDGLTVFNLMINSPIRPSKKLLESAANLIHEGNLSEFSLIDDQIVARNVIVDKIRKLGKKNSVIIVKGGPGTGKTVIALHILVLLAGNKKKDYNVHYATKSKPLLEGVKNRLPYGSEAKKLFSNVLQFIPANFDENELDVLLVDEAHRITISSNHRYTKPDKFTELTQIQTIIRASKISVFFIDDRQAIRSAEIGSSELIRECAKEYGAELVEVELKSQFRCNGSDNYLDWLEQVIYNEPVKASFEENEFDFKIFNDPQELYDEIKSKEGIDGQTARLCAGFCWPWSNRLSSDGQFINDIVIGNFAMPWETHDKIERIPEGYVRWYEWAYKPEGIKQVGCIYTAQGFEFDYIGVIVGNDLKYDKKTDSLVTNIASTKDPMLKRDPDGFDKYVRNIYRVLMSRGMKGCYVYFVDPDTANYFKSRLKHS